MPSEQPTISKLPSKFMISVPGEHPHSTGTGEHPLNPDYATLVQEIVGFSGFVRYVMDAFPIFVLV